MHKYTEGLFEIELFDEPVDSSISLFWQISLTHFVGETQLESKYQSMSRSATRLD